MKIFTVRHRFLVFGITISVIAAFAAMGWILGTWVLTRPAMIILFVVLSFPVSQFVLVKRLRIDVQKAKERGDYAQH